ncbi:WXG100 family type VII secretion target [uncultured Dietzia sp.]|uniref:WXG100 family type VII secretion target n=1 Tax=uncultured Dietzia sp. TaxID=395519 RepID=UPI0025E162C0|nr:glycine zipper domain-containing protein [uncultured Dietzia sp.]
MTYSVGQVRNWEVGALVEAGDAVAGRASVAHDVRSILSEGGEALDEGWDGLAADAVLDAVELEKAHVSKLADGLDDLVDALRRAQAALGSAVQAVRDRITEAEGVGLEVGDELVRPAAGRDDIGQSVVDEHAEAIRFAVDTVRSLDEHYGGEIDEIATRLHGAIPSEVDRSPIPGPDDPWPGRGVDAMTAAASKGYPDFADELDPGTRGKHKLNPVPDDFGRAAGTGLRGLGRFAGPLGGGLTVYDGMKAHAEGKTSTGEAIVETTAAFGGGALGGAAAGAAAGTVFGPVGTFIGAGIGAAVGTYLGQKAGDAMHEKFS